MEFGEFGGKLNMYLAEAEDLLARIERLILRSFLTVILIKGLLHALWS